MTPSDGWKKPNVIFFAHQTVELALKSYLIAHHIDFPKVHALPQLLSLCIQKDPKRFLDLADDMAFLNGFYIEAKYPLDVTFDPSPQNTTRSLSVAEAVVRRIEQKL